MCGCGDGTGGGEPGGDMQLEYAVFCRLGYLHGGRVRGEESVATTE